MRPRLTSVWPRVRRMTTFVLRLIAPRPNFAQTLTSSEREIMSSHAAHWRPYLERGDMVVFGPVLTDEDSYGLAVVETDDEQALARVRRAGPTRDDRNCGVRARAARRGSRSRRLNAVVQSRGYQRESSALRRVSRRLTTVSRRARTSSLAIAGLLIARLLLAWASASQQDRGPLPSGRALDRDLVGAFGR